MDNIEARVVNAMNEWNLGDGTVTATSRFKEDLQMDSLDVLEAIMLVEDEFGIEVPDEDAEKWVAVSDIVNYLKTLKA